MCRFTFFTGFLFVFMSQHMDIYSSSGVNSMPDTMQIRLLKNKLDAEKYINAQKDHYYRLIPLAKRTGDEKLLAECNYELSFILFQQAEYAKSMDYVNQSLQYYEKINDERGRAKSYWILANLYSFLSPDLADYFYEQSMKLATVYDYTDILIIKYLMMMHPYSKIESITKELAGLDCHDLDIEQKAAFSYISANIAHRSGETEKALEYALIADHYYSQDPRHSFMDACCKHELALIYLDLGNLPKAKCYLEFCNQICKRDHFELINIFNLKTESEIKRAEGDEDGYLLTFREYIAKHDSLLGREQTAYLSEILMRNMLDITVHEYFSEKKNNQDVFYIVLGVIVLLSAFTLYYFKRMFHRKKERYKMLAQLTERKWEVGTNPELKQHLSKVILEYKKGLDFYIGQLRNNNDYVQRYKQLAQYIEETGQFIDKLGEWIEEHPAREEKNAFFDAQPKIKTVINMLQIIFMSKQITIHNKIHSNGPLMVYGKEIYFSIAFELIVNMALENAGPKQQIILSVKENKDFYIFTVNDPSYILFDEDAMKMNWRIQKVKASIGKEKSGDHDLEIFLECVYENNGEMRFESSLAHGTSSSFSIPKRKLL